MAASTSTNLILKALLLLFVASTGTLGRPMSAKSSLLARLKLDSSEGDENSECWESLFQLQSCTGEVILFFMNGETFLGPNCCHAIRIVERNCWASMLGSLGFTTQESDVLRGYCDAEAEAEDEDDHIPVYQTPSPILLNNSP